MRLIPQTIRQTEVLMYYISEVSKEFLDTTCHRPRGKPITMILLNEHGNQTTSNDIMLYPQISASLDPRQRSFLLQ